MEKIYCKEYDLIIAENDFRILIYKNDLIKEEIIIKEEENNIEFEVKKIIYDEFTNPIYKEKMPFNLVILDLDLTMFNFIKEKRKTYIAILDKSSILYVFESIVKKI